jgi:hypothetical protein
VDAQAITAWHPAPVARQLTAVAAIGVVLAGWWWTHRDSDVPSPEMALAVARDHWKGACGDRDQQWPCVIPTDIRLDSHAPRKVQGYSGAGLGYCFTIYFNAETTLWDPAQEFPRSPALTPPSRRRRNNAPS